MWPAADMKGIDAGGRENFSLAALLAPCLVDCDTAVVQKALLWFRRQGGTVHGEWGVGSRQYHNRAAGSCTCKVPSPWSSP